MKKVINRLFADNKGRGVFRVENAAGAEATIYLYDVIVSDSGYDGGVSAIDFVQALAGTTAQTIHLRINSPGGEVFAAQAMAQAIREHPAKCVAHIDGLAASCASWIAIAADETVISHGGMVMIHNAMTICMGNAADMRECADLLDKVDGILVDAYVNATGQTAEQVSAWMAAETWFNATEAVANGFADSIAESATKNLATWNLSAYAHAPEKAPEPEQQNSEAPINTDHLRRRLALAATV